MEKVKRFFTSEVALSIIIPLIISLFSYVAAQAKYTERLGVAEKKIEIVDTSGTQRLQNHLIEDARSNEQLLAEIKVLQSKVDQVRDDIKELRARK